jgi:hypothetical protein
MKKKREVKIDRNQIVKIVDQILESNFWIHGLRTNYFYQRPQDDHDGDPQKGILGVCMDQSGDAHISVGNHESSRFRMPGGGGGNSPRVRIALMILARAIQEDNEDHPLQQ